MRIKFYLKRPKPGPGASNNAKASFNQNSLTAIFALVNFEGHSLKVYTGEAIAPKHWNSKTNHAKNTESFPEHPEFNERLNQIKSSINRVFLDYKNRNDGAMPSPAILKPLIETALKRGNEKTSFLEYFDSFVRRSETGQRLDHRSKKSIRPGVAKGYKTTFNHLKKFAQLWHRKLDFETVDLEFHNDFTTYLSESPRFLSINTIGSSFQRIKAVMAEATEKHINTNMAFKSKYFIKQSEDADTIYLDESELKEMRELNLSANKRLDNVRDIFLISCYTGLRFSDHSILQSANISDGFIRINQTKTGRPVTIPVHSVVKKILAKHNGNTPKAISNVNLNAYLKELGERMKSLKKIESRGITRAGVRVVKSSEKWKLLTSHTARRSFATNEYKAGTPTITIMAITGHKSERSFLKYIRVTPDEHAYKMASLWADRELKAV